MTYLYCVVRRKRRPSAAGAPPGLPGAGRPRLLDAAHSLWLVAATAPRSRYGETPIEKGLRDLTWVSRCAVAHEAVVEHFLRAGDLVPMKLFTIFASDDRAVSHIGKTRRQLARVFERIGGCFEWGVRVTLGPARPARRPSARAASASKHRAVGASRSGARYLMVKQARLTEERELAGRARITVDELFDDLAGHARDAKRQAIPDVRAVRGARDASRLLLDAAYLVPAGRTRRFQAAVRGYGRRLASAGHQVVLTGPWPAYNFIVSTSKDEASPPPGSRP